MAQYGIGAGAGGLTGYGIGQQEEAMGILSQSANAEQERNMANKAAKQQAKAGNAQLGSTLGSMAGYAIGGPIGGMVGGLIGGGLGSLF